MGPMSKSWTAELGKYQQLSENWTRCGEIETLIWTPKWNFTTSVSFPQFYACECWTLNERDKAWLDAFDMICQPKILRIVWSQHITNSPIRSRTKQAQLTAVIKKRHLQWIGHIQRMSMDRIHKKLYLWKPAHGKRRSGRPKTSWRAVIQNGISKMDLGWTEEEADRAARYWIMWKYLSNAFLRC